jgi:hypothetical protein
MQDEETPPEPTPDPVEVSGIQKERPDSQNEKGPLDPAEVADIQKHYAEAISRTTKFLVLTAVFLIILIIIVGQELREYRSKQASLEQDIATYAADLRKVNKQLNGKYREIWNDYSKDEQAKAAFDFHDIPPPIEHIGDARAIDALVSREQGLGALINKLKDKKYTGKRSNSAGDNQQQSSTSNVQTPSRERRRQSSPPPQVAQAVDRTNKAITLWDLVRKGHKSAFSPRSADCSEPSLECVVVLLDEYKELYHARISPAQRLLSATNATKELSASKKSIPTPFGSFEVAPRLALLALSFAALINYFIFNYSTRRMRALAREYKHAFPDDNERKITAHVPAPFWLYSKESNDEQMMDWSRGAAYLSFALHFAWLVIAGWLAFESLFRWNATKALVFSYKIIWVYVLIACLVMSALLTLWTFIPAKARRSLLRAKKSSLSVYQNSRRAFVGLSALAVLSVASGGILYLLRRRVVKKGQRPYSVPVSQLGLDAERNPWIVHKRTNVVHYVGLCSKHLPFKYNQLENTVAPTNLLIHSGYTLRILEDLAKRTLPQPGQEEHAISLLKQAIALSPLSFHYYDRLVKIYGVLRRYEEIKPLLGNGLKQVDLKLVEINKFEDSPQKTKSLDRLKRAQKGFQLRIKQVNYRKQRAEEYRADKELKAQAEKKKS